MSQATLSTSSDIKTVHRGGNGLDKGVIAGIAVGSIAAVALILVAAWYFMRVFRPQQKRRRNSRFRARIEAQNADLPDTQVQQPPDDTEMHEYYNTKRPFSPDSDTRQELDASKTARGSIGARAEMESPTPSSMGSPRDKMSPRQSYGFSTSPAELESRSPRMMHSRTASGSSFGQLSPTETLGRRELERTEEAHELP